MTDFAGEFFFSWRMLVMVKIEKAAKWPFYLASPSNFVDFRRSNVHFV